MTWHCNDCGSEFISGHSTACFQCGSVDTMPAEENTKESLSAFHTEAISDTREVIKEILKELCVEAYENPYRGKEWEEVVKELSRNYRLIFL